MFSSVVRSCFILNSRKAFCYASSTQVSLKDRIDLQQQQRSYAFGEGDSGMSALERLLVPGCLVGAPKWIEQLGLSLGAVEV